MIMSLLNQRNIHYCYQRGEHVVLMLTKKRKRKKKKERKIKLMKERILH